MFDFMNDGFGIGNNDYVVAEGPFVPEPHDCMRCGICLSHCPTYQLNKDEQEGPRQRIRILNKLVLLKETVDEEAIMHLNNCLQCGACEAVCPSQMSYSELFDKAQHELNNDKNKSVYAKLALSLIAEKKKLKLALPLIYFYQLGGIRWLTQKLGLLKLMKLDVADQMLRPPALKSLNDTYSISTETKGRVALFTGCISEHFDRETLNASIKVLNALGYEVSIPKQQVCCGAIHYHNGAPEVAKTLMQQNRTCFNNQDVDAIIYCATGCGVQFQKYPLALELDENDSAFKIPLFEVMDFIAKHWDEKIKLNPLPGKVKVHESCSQRNVLKNQQSVYDLLNKIPGIEVETLAENDICCGAGGSYMLTHEKTAKTLRDNKWQNILNSNADYVVTSNIGCNLHLQAFNPIQQNVVFKHPVCMIAKQL